jgi:hypothetical protein
MCMNRSDHNNSLQMCSKFSILRKTKFFKYFGNFQYMFILVQKYAHGQ